MADIIEYLESAEHNSSDIMVVGVGGGGGNAVKHMYNLGIHNVMFMVCNTDNQALAKNPVPKKIQLGKDSTKGLGAGNKPERGRAAAIESTEEIRECLQSSNAKMIFITAGMGGGTGTGAAPIISQIAKELGILTVAIVTIPFRTEGETRVSQAMQGVEDIRVYVDSLLIIDNENINKMYGDLTFSEAFGKADDILATAAKGIAEIITKEHQFNVDFADVHTTMSNSGVALMGAAIGEIGGEDIAIALTEQALMSPLLNQKNIAGAKDILVNISWNDSELKMKEVHKIIEHVQAAAGRNASLIWGAGRDESLDSNQVSVIIIATGFTLSQIPDDIKYLFGGMIDDDKSKAAGVEFKPEVIVPSDGPVVKIPIDDIPKPEFQGVVSSFDDIEVRMTSSNTQEADLVAHNHVTNGVAERLVLSLDDEPEKPHEPVDLDNDIVIKSSSSRPKKNIRTPNTPLFPGFDIETDISKEQHHGYNNVTMELSIDQLEELPAYERRKMLAMVKNKDRKVVSKLVDTDKE